MKSLVIINPRSGDYSFNRFVTDFIHYKPHWITVDISLFDEAFNLKSIEKALKNYDSLIIAGGDGTISSISSFLAELAHPPPFAVIPIGTGNDFSRSSGWYEVWRKGKFEAFFEQLKKSNIKNLDLWHYYNNKFICYFSIGWDASVVSSYYRIKKRLKLLPQNRRRNTLLYIYCALIKLKEFLIHKKNNTQIAVQQDGECTKTISFNSGTTIILSNIKSYAGGTSLGNTIREDDEKLDFYLLRNPFEYIYFVIRGRFSLFNPQTANSQLREIDISSELSYPHQIDGEYLGEIDRKKISIGFCRKISYLKP